MKCFEPDFMHIVNAANNNAAGRLPLYEHIISDKCMEDILGIKFSDLFNGDQTDLDEYFRNYCNFFMNMGYDTVSFEMCISSIMPGNGALGRHLPGAIKNRDDFVKYPWDIIPDIFFNSYSKYFNALRKAMPAGMKAIGGPGNGVFECVQDIVGYSDLCYISADDPELYVDLFKTVGKIIYIIWSRFLNQYSDIYCVCRFGDDLGYKSSTLVKADDIRNIIIPEYSQIIKLIHSYNKPFLFHSCGCIFDVMDDLINIAKIDAKHSNEDQIARFPVWVEKYGDRIGNFGGIDTDMVCILKNEDLKEYILEVIRKCEGHGGFAFGSGNSIPDYVPTENYINMVNIVREYRGDYREQV